jgi:site-specific DNA-cytosine methylase
MNILSLFDGMSCGQIALNRAGIKYDKYYASEVDKYAIRVTQANYSDTIQIGDIDNWQEWDIDWSAIGLIMAGSPCQGFSFAGKQLAFDDPRSKLFFKFVDILEHVKTYNPGVKFLLENVKMKKCYVEKITEILGVEPVEINSALVSAQNRKRLYWANWVFGQPKDKGILLKDVLESGGTGYIKSHGEFKEKPIKSQCIDANYHKGVDNHGQRTMVLKDNVLILQKPRGNNRGGARAKDGKTPCLSGSAWEHNNHLLENFQVRKLTPIECERLQTVPDNYTNHISNTQRYRMLGNGWTVDVIAHILRNLEG